MEEDRWKDKKGARGTGGRREVEGGRGGTGEPSPRRLLAGAGAAGARSAGFDVPRPTVGAGWKKSRCADFYLTVSVTTTERIGQFL